jgi:ketosteroid isomerase-like protein
MSDSNNTAIIQRAYQQFQNGDIDAVVATLDDNVDWTLPKIEGVRISGQHRGHADVRRFFEMLSADQDVMTFEPREFATNDDTVVAIGEYRWRVKATGKEYGSSFVHAFTFRDGRVIRFREFMDTAAAAEGYRA